jgi:dTMP kinase
MSKDNVPLSFKGFISFEGIEGCGKTTQVKLLKEYLSAKNHHVLVTEEPGGTKIGHKIRKLLLSPENHMDPLTEFLLYNASRAQLIREVIYPALVKDTIVITDRFIDSTVAYQGHARGLDSTIINTLNEIVSPDLKPFVTFLLDLDVKEGLKRNRGAQKTDRLELETIEFHEQVRKGYEYIARESPDRVKVIDASGSIEQVNKKIIETLEAAWH